MVTTYWMPWFSDFPIARKDPSGVWDEGYPLFATKEEALAYAREWADEDPDEPLNDRFCHAERCVLTSEPHQSR